MTCNEIKEQLHEVADGRGDAAVRAHVQGCAPCQAEVQRYRELWTLLLASRSVELSRGFNAALQAKLPSSSRILRFTAPLVAAAAAVFIIVSITIWPSGPSSSSIDEDLSRLSPEDRELFVALDQDEAWDLVEQYDLVRAMDAVVGEWPASEEDK